MMPQIMWAGAVQVLPLILLLNQDNGDSLIMGKIY